MTRDPNEVELARWRDLGRRLVVRDGQGNVGLNADYRLAQEAAALLDAEDTRQANEEFERGRRQATDDSDEGAPA